LKATKLVTGHNLDDETHTVLMNFLKGNLLLGVNSKPLTGQPREGFVQRVKPLFFVDEEEIRKYSKMKNFPVLYEKCPCAFGTYRIETRHWMNSLQLSTKEKLEIVQNFQKIIPKLAKKQGEREMRECKFCSEPTNHEVCNACQILGILK